MSAKSPFANAIGLILLSGVCLFAFNAITATAQQSKKPVEWEYKAVTFRPHQKEDHTKKLNQLALQRWEYVGLIIPAHNTGGQYAAKSVVAFRRPK